MKNFNLEEAKQGKPVCTRDGKPARIICFDRAGMYPIVALIGENEACMVASNTGESNINGPESDYDLMMA